MDITIEMVNFAIKKEQDDELLYIWLHSDKSVPFKEFKAKVETNAKIKAKYTKNISDKEIIEKASKVKERLLGDKLKTNNKEAIK